MVERQIPPPYDFSKFRDPRFQPILGYENIERAPQSVIKQTSLLLQLYRARAITQPKIAKDYLHDYTSRFINMASQGVARVFTKDDAVIKAQPLEINEAADFTSIVFAWMHYFAESQLLPNGFSRKGMLRAPTTKEQFLQRTGELKRELAFVAAEARDPDMPLEIVSSVFRTHMFFHIGATIPLKFPDNEKELVEKERNTLDKLLGDIKIDL